MGTLCPEDWGLETRSDGGLAIGSYGLAELAETYGTPLHVLNEERLESSARAFRSAMESAYRGTVSVHYAFKCNSVPAVVETIKRAGLHAEVMTEFELHLAQRLGYSGENIIVNGPCKTPQFLKECVEAGVRLIVLDSLDELHDLETIVDTLGVTAHVLLRVNPDVVPHGVNAGSATGSRRGCAFGLDLKGGEVQRALTRLRGMERINFQGYHFHIGTGITRPDDYGRALQRLPELLALSRKAGLAVNILDVGGGIASPTSREFTGFEMLAYGAFGRLPGRTFGAGEIQWFRFASRISSAIERSFSQNDLPELIYEPGRTIVSPNQMLLLRVRRIKERAGVAKWIITDGGLGTVTLPTYYEFHEIFLCDDVRRPRTEKVTIIGPACFAGDIVYQNKSMPELRVGETLALMDSGAYFTALESSFGFPRPAIVTAGRRGHRLVRSRETFEHMMSRDVVSEREEVEQ